MSNRAFERLKAFAMTNQMAMEDISQIAVAHGVDLGHEPLPTQAVVDAYYPQFDAAVRKERAATAKHYEVLYALEKTIRALVPDPIDTAEQSASWWSSARVAPAIQAQVATRIQNDVDAGV